MIHFLVAQIWAHLVKQRGSETVLLQAYLDKASTTDSLTPNEAYAAYMHFIVCARTIIDLQRARLQASGGVAALPVQQQADLISQDLILQILEKLLNTKDVLYPINSSTPIESVPHRIYLLQTILCALRLLVLRNEAVNVVWLPNFDGLLKVHWKHPSVKWLEEHTLEHLVPSAMRHLLGRDGTRVQKEEAELLQECGVPAGFSNRTGLKLRPFDLVRSASSESGSNTDPSLFFWRIFDALWATESAIIQCFNGNLHRASEVTPWTTAEDKFYRIRLARDNLYETAFNSPNCSSSSTFPLVKPELRFCLTSTLLKMDAPDSLRAFKLEPTEPMTAAKSFLGETLAKHLDSLYPNLEKSLCNILEWIKQWSQPTPRPDSVVMPLVWRSADPDKAPLRPQQLSVVPPTPAPVEHFALSSSGSSVLIWGNTFDGVLRYSIDTTPSNDLLGQRTILGLPSTPLAVGSGSLVTAVASEQAGTIRLMFFRYRTLSSWTEIEIPGKIVTIQLAVSRNDMWVGMLLDHKVYIYQISENKYRQFECEDRIEIYREYALKRIEGFEQLSHEHKEQEGRVMGVVRERRLSFTSSSNFVVIATALSDEHVYVDAWGLFTAGSPLTTRPGIMQLPPQLPNDHGLSGVCYDERAGEAFLTADVARDYAPGVRLDAPTPILETVDHVNKTVALAQTLEVDRYLLVNSQGQVRLVKNAAGGAEVARVKAADIGVGTLGYGDARVAVASGEIAVILWVTRKRKLKLKIVDLKSQKRIKAGVL